MHRFGIKSDLKMMVDKTSLQLNLLDIAKLSCSVAGHSLVTAFLLLLSFIFYWLMLSCILCFFGTLVIVLIFPWWA